MSNNPFHNDGLYYSSLVLNIISGGLTLYCTFFEYKFSRNRWYLVTNALACLLNASSIGEITLRRNQTQVAGVPSSPEIIGFTINNFTLTLVVFLLLIKQNSTILECFSFLNKKMCSMGLRFGKWFLLIDSIVSAVICILAGYYYCYFGYLEHPTVTLMRIIYAANSSTMGLFLGFQTIVQNFWISFRVYKIAKLNGMTKERSRIFHQLVFILGSLYAVDL